MFKISLFNALIGIDTRIMTCTHTLITGKNIQHPTPPFFLPSLNVKLMKDHNLEIPHEKTKDQVINGMTGLKINIYKSTSKDKELNLTCTNL